MIKIMNRDENILTCYKIKQFMFKFFEEFVFNAIVSMIRTKKEGEHVWPK
jgi:hypothetical protein